MNRKTTSLFIGLMLSVAAFASSQSSTYAPGFSDTLLFKNRLHRNIIRLSPNPTLNGTVSINSATNEGVLHLYVFDLSGTMVHQGALRGKEKYVLRNLKKGIYIYDVFKDDESIDGGRIIVK